MTNVPDPDRLRLSTHERPAPRPRRTPRRRGYFLKGPIPWNWLSAAARLPGRALHVALSIRFWTGIKKTDRIAVSVSGLSELGLSRHAVYRGLKVLEEAGLVSVVRHRGRKPWVTVMDIDSQHSQGDVTHDDPR